jgi:hypothetical protein
MKTPAASTAIVARLRPTRRPVFRRARSLVDANAVVSSFRRKARLNPNPAMSRSAPAPKNASADLPPKESHGDRGSGGDDADHR